MLTTRIVPIGALARMKATHSHVMIALYAYADKDGRCWPSLRTLAEMTTMSLGAVQRAIAEMASLGYIHIAKRFKKSSVYQISGRFLVRKVPPDNPQSASAEASSQTRCIDSRPARLAGGTEGVAKGREDKFIKKEIGVGRFAPSKPPDRVRDPSRYNQTLSANKRDGWLDNLNAWAGENLAGDDLWRMWELAPRAKENWEAISYADRQWLNKMSDRRLAMRNAA